LFLRHRNAKSPPGQARRVVRQSSLTLMVPHGPVTKSQSDIMPNVAHNGLANAFPSLLIRFPLFNLLSSGSNLHRPCPLASISSCKAPIIEDTCVFDVTF
ncbi:MAG: hypothetical protein MSA12_04890, partial [Collinsella sp.]|nr:hypothetical protein [Collinsella sp.]